MDTIVNAPAAVDAEAAILACLLADGNSIAQVMGFLKTEDFFLLRHRQIYDAILTIMKRGEEIDDISVSGELRLREQLDRIGGDAYLTGLDAPNYTHIVTYAELVERAAVRRRLQTAGSKLANLANDGDKDIDEVLDEAETIFRTATKRGADRFIIRGDMLVDEAFDEWLQWADVPAEIRGLSSGINGLDRILGGLTPGVYAIGGATSMGKSTLCAFITRKMAEQGHGLLCPTETPGKTMFHKMAGDMVGIPFKELRSGKYRSPSINNLLGNAYTELRGVARNIRVLDTSHPSLSAIHAEVLRMPNCQWVVIDSGSKLAGAVKTGDERLLDSVNRVSAFSQDLARLGLVVIVTWQFGRNAKDRAVKVPQLNDFKESGAIEEDADVCLGIYRHDYYVNRSMAEPDPERFPPGTAKLLLLKDRAGADGDEAITLHFKAGRGFFENVNREAFEGA